jgi:hypothetical protein
LENEASLQNQLDDSGAFSHARIAIVNGSMRSGKSVYCVAKIREAYDKDCILIYCRDILKIDCEVKAYYREDRVAKIKHKNVLKYIEIPKSYELKSPMRIFSNIHLYGIPYVYVPTFKHMLVWLKNGFISDGFLLIDEAHVGMSARGTQTLEGRAWVSQIFQLAKSQLEVFLITHEARMIDLLARFAPTKRVFCEYDEKTKRVNYTLKEKGVQGEKKHSFYAPQYWGNYRTSEKVNA